MEQLALECTLIPRDKTIKPLPQTFATEEEAGEFWDAHSTMDYEEYLEPADDVTEIIAVCGRMQLIYSGFHLHEELRLQFRPMFIRFLSIHSSENRCKQRVFEVPVEEDVFQRLQQEAQSLHKSVPKVVDHILRERLAMTET